MDRNREQRGPIERDRSLSVVWSRERPMQLESRELDRPEAPARLVKLSAANAKALQDTVQIAFSNPQIGFYDPQADLAPRGAARRVRPHRLNWSTETVEGSMEVWGPAMPGDNASQPEPREILFAGESGFLVLHIKNRGRAPVTIAGAGVQTRRTGAIQGRATANVAIPGRGSVTYAVPVTVAEDAEAAFAPVTVRVSCIIGGRKVSLRHSVHISVGRLVDFSQQWSPSKDPEMHELAVSMTAETPGGFRETVSATLGVQFRVDREGSVDIRMVPRAYEATVLLAAGFTPGAVALPRNVYALGSFRRIFRTTAKAIFCMATAAIMAGLATVGVAATKVLLAAAAQALGPAVGVPVTLVLYSPPIEAFFAAAATKVLRVAGAVLNAELFDLIF